MPEKQLNWDDEHKGVWGPQFYRTATGIGSGLSSMFTEDGSNASDAGTMQLTMRNRFEGFNLLPANHSFSGTWKCVPGSFLIVTIEPPANKPTVKSALKSAMKSAKDNKPEVQAKDTGGPTMIEGTPHAVCAMCEQETDSLKKIKDIGCYLCSGCLDYNRARN